MSFVILYIFYFGELYSNSGMKPLTACNVVNETLKSVSFTN